MKTRTEVYTREDGRFAWRMIAGNGQVVATDGGQGYENRADAEEMAGRFSYREPSAEIEVDSADDRPNPRVRAYLTSLGIDVRGISVDGWDAEGYDEFVTDEKGKRVFLGDEIARAHRAWPEGFDFQKFIDLWALDAHTRRWKP